MTLIYYENIEKVSIKTIFNYDKLAHTLEIIISAQFLNIDK